MIESATVGKKTGEVEGSGTSPVTRDPRKEPRPGDVLLVDAIPGNVTPNRGGFRREVNLVYRNRRRGVLVDWIVGQFGYTATIKEWRRLNKDAEVLHAGLPASADGAVSAAGEGREHVAK